jgi:hypothetical protein
MRTDQNNNPVAFDCDVAHQAWLVYGTDYEQGTPFQSEGVTYYTAKLLGDPVALTIRVIDAIGFYTKADAPRWLYMGQFPKFVWNALTPDQKRDVVGFMYQREAGEAMRNLFPNYGAL